MAPLYQVMALPGTSNQAFTISDAYVPASQSNSSGAGNLNLTAYMIGNSDPGHYGDLTVYKTPQSTPGPANADSYIQENAAVSKDITLLDQKGSEVLLGNTLMVPIGQSLIYLRPMYVASSTNPLPQLTYVIGVIGQHVVINSSLSQTLTALLKTTVTTGAGGPTSSGGSTGGSTTSGTLPPVVQQDLTAAQSLYAQALVALKAGDLGTYQSDIDAMEQQITNAQKALTTAGTAPTTTTTTTPAAAKKTKSTSKSGTPTSTEPKGTTTTSTTLAAAAGAAGTG
jgi:hypothetical protein